jgi:transcriptional regulator with GAF, ATPase, and Fis domain
MLFMKEIQDLHTQLAAASRALQNEADTHGTLRRSVRLAIELIPHCHYSGIAIVGSDRTITTALATDPLVVRGDELQYELGQGPCLDAIWHHETVVISDLAAERRWPTWAPRLAAELEVTSMLCVQLFTSSTIVGALNLYSRDLDAFDHSDVDTATVLAAHIAVAVADTQKADQLRLSATSRSTIGQAQGILMERYRLNDTQAFLALRRVSQDNNIKLVNVAQKLVQTRVTPGL